jgi:hypothetical protein
MGSDLEEFWADVLSESSSRAVTRLAALDDETREAVLAHLRRMASEAGWSEGQRRRAAFALAEWEHRPDSGDPPSSRTAR